MILNDQLNQTPTIINALTTYNVNIILNYCRVWPFKGQSARTAKGTMQIIAEMPENLIFKREGFIKITRMDCPASF